jgi:hypothetical protein
MTWYRLYPLIPLKGVPLLRVPACGGAVASSAGLCRSLDRLERGRQFTTIVRHGDPHAAATGGGFRTILRFAGGREISLGDLAERGVCGGANALIAGNYLTTLGRAADADIDILKDLKMPIKALAKNL